MDWKDIAGKIAGFAPTVASLLALTGVGAPAAAAVAAAGSLVASALGCPNTPDDVSQALISNPNAAVQLKQIETEHADLLATLANQGEAKALDTEGQALSTVNQTMQAEDKTRSFSWRDYWGYVSGTAFAFVVLVVCYLVGAGVYLGRPELLNAIPNVVGAFSLLFGIAATVLGVHSAIDAYHSGMTDRILAGNGVAK